MRFSGRDGSDVAIIHRSHGWTIDHEPFRFLADRVERLTARPLAEAEPPPRVVDERLEADRLVLRFFVAAFLRPREEFAPPPLALCFVERFAPLVRRPLPVDGVV